MARISRIRILFGRKTLTDEHEEELQFHLSMREESNVESGMTRIDAHRDARRRFGNPVRWRERMSEIDVMIWPQTVLQDLRDGARMLWRNAGFTMAAVFALAVGIGVNTAAFTAYKAFVIRPLDAHNSAEMVNIALNLGFDNRSGDFQPLFSYPDYLVYRDRAHSFSGIIATSLPQNLALSVTGGIVSQRNSAAGMLVARSGLIPSASYAESASTFLVSDNYFSVLGVTPMRGRLSAAGEAEAGTSPEALISENY